MRSCKNELLEQKKGPSQQRPLLGGNTKKRFHAVGTAFVENTSGSSLVLLEGGLSGSAPSKGVAFKRETFLGERGDLILENFNMKRNISFLFPRFGSVSGRGRNPLLLKKVPQFLYRGGSLDENGRKKGNSLSSDAKRGDPCRILQIRERAGSKKKRLAMILQGSSRRRRDALFPL